MSLTRFVSYVRTVAKAHFERFIYRNMFPAHLQIGFAENARASLSGEDSSIMGDSIWFAGPKSKISPGRKRDKHGRFFPDAVGWQQCDRCGEAKRPHRICTKYAQLCSMREEDWKNYKRTHAVDVAQRLHLAKATENENEFL